MPIILRTIDEIAREKQRGVLFVTFEDSEPYGVELFDLHYKAPLHIRNKDTEEIFADGRRTALVKWLDDNQIGHENCFPLMGGHIVFPWSGSLYIDVPLEQDDPRYIQVVEHLENDGEPKDPLVKLWSVSLEAALRAEQENDWYDGDY